MLKNKKTWLFLVLVAALAVVPQLSIASSYVMSVFNMLLVNIIIVLGLNFITGLTGQMNLGTAGIWALGAYTYGILTTPVTNDVVINPWLVMIILVVLGCLIGRGLGYPSLRLKGFYLSLTTIGFSEIVRMLIMNTPSLTNGVNGIKEIPKLSLGFYTFHNDKDYYYLLLFFAVLATLIAYKLVGSKWGRAFKSIRDNAEASEACGIKISTLKIQAFTLAALYACLAGGLYAGMRAYISPTTFTIPASQNYVAMLMLGGIGTVPGNILGAVLVTTLPELLRGLGDYYWLVFCTVCLVMAVLVPDGPYSVFKRLVKQAVARTKKTGGAA